MSDNAQEIPVTDPNPVEALQPESQPEDWKIKRAATLVKARKKAADLRNAIRIASDTISPPVVGKQTLKKKLSELNEKLSNIPTEDVVVANEPIDQVDQEETIVEDTPIVKPQAIVKAKPSIPKEKPQVIVKETPSKKPTPKKVDFQEEEKVQATFYSRIDRGFYYY